VNVGTLPAIHGIALIQADGKNQLRIRGTADNPRNSGDAGDPFPGWFARASGDWTRQTELTSETHPAWVLNHDGAGVGYGLYGIQETGRERGVENRIRFDLRQDGDLAPVYARSDREDLEIVADGVRTRFWMGRLRDGHRVTLGIDSLTVFGDENDRAWVFRAWSNGGPRVQTVHGPMDGDTLLATTSLVYRVRAEITGEGFFQGLPDSTNAGLFHAPNDTLVLVAVPAEGQYLRGFDGDAQRFAVRGDTAILDMSGPLSIHATFVPIPVLTTDAIIDQLLVGGQHLSEDALFYLDHHGNRNGRLDVGDVLAWIERAEDPAEAAQAAQSLFRAMKGAGGDGGQAPAEPEPTDPPTERPARTPTSTQEISS
jgi:hypothetical protein